MWKISEGPITVRPLADHHRYLYVIERDAERREIYVELSGTAAACAPETLPDPIGTMVATDGHSTVELYLRDDEPPIKVTVDTTRWRPIYREPSEAI